MEAGRALNSKVFSLARLELLAALAPLSADGAAFRELKAGLQLSDGALHSNLKALKEMGYVKSKEFKVENKKLDVFWITPEGLQEFGQTKKWLEEFADFGGGGK